MFDYFYGVQADQFSFYRIPKVLFTNEFFREMSTDSKTLYGILLDRMNLSARNGWLDKNGRVYIIFTIEEIMDAMGCGDRKANRMLAELEKTYGLIERKRQGLGKPNLIFVKNFISIGQNCRALNRQNNDSGTAEITNQESSKRRANNTDSNHTDLSDTDPFHSGKDAERETTDERSWLRSYFYEQLGIQDLKRDCPLDADMIEEIWELVVDTCCSNRRMIRIAGDDKPKDVVKSQLMKLDIEHMKFVLSCLHENTTKIRNMKQYLLTTLYNAPMTMGNYYQALVNHDMANGLI